MCSSGYAGIVLCARRLKHVNQPAFSCTPSNTTFKRSCLLVPKIIGGCGGGTAGAGVCCTRACASRLSLRVCKCRCWSLLRQMGCIPMRLECHGWGSAYHPSSISMHPQSHLHFPTQPFLLLASNMSCTDTYGQCNVLGIHGVYRSLLSSLSMLHP